MDRFDAERRRDRVIIAAAVAAMFGRRATVRQVRAIAGDRGSDWMREGRLAIQTSHRMNAPLIQLAVERKGVKV